MFKIHLRKGDIREENFPLPGDYRGTIIRGEIISDPFIDGDHIFYRFRDLANGKEYELAIPKILAEEDFLKELENKAK